MPQTWETTVLHMKKRPDPAGKDGSQATDGASCATKGPAKRPVEKPHKGPGKYAFLPWLLMGMGAFSNIIQGKTGNPWLAGLGLLAFNSLYISVVWSSFNPRLRDSRRPL